MNVKKLSLFGLGALLFAASCSNDDLLSDANKPLEDAQSFFIPISVNGFGDNAGTRAGAIGDYGNTDENPAYDAEKEPNFSKGEGNENTVQNVYLLFYDANGNKVADAQALKTGTGGNLTGPSYDGLNNAENSLYYGVVQVDVERGGNIPAYVLAFVNPRDGLSEFNATGGKYSTLAEVEKATTSNLVDTQGLFAMSNSVYYGTDPYTGVLNTRIMATPIANNKIFTSKDEAKDAITNADTAEESSTVDIYVERYAGKVNFSIKPGDNATSGIVPLTVTGYDGEEYTLTFVPEYWTVNANEQSSFITKTFYNEKAAGGEIDFTNPRSYDEMNAILSPWKWNSETFHRSYWGQSPAYYSATYPRVTDDILENRKDGSSSSDLGGYDLKYYSYDEIKNNAGTGTGDLARSFDSNSALYPRENTVAGQVLKDAYADPLASPRAAIASVVFVGQYHVTKDADDVTPGDGVRFYITGNETTGYTYYTESQMKTYFLEHTITLATDADGENPLAANSEYITVEHPSAEVRGNLVIDGRYVTLQLTEAAVNKVYAKVGDNLVPVTDENIDAINQNIMSTSGLAFGFDGGKAFFSIPIQHLGYYRSTNSDNQAISGGANSADFIWDNVKSGDFGIVRNHVYTIQANVIRGLGNAIPNPDEPIVPPTDPDQYYIGARIIVLNWAIVPTQSVDL